MLAGHGFVVAVPEIYHEFEPAGTVLAYDQPAPTAATPTRPTKDIAAYDADARAVARSPASPAPTAPASSARSGICIGGHLAFRAAMNPDVLAGVCFYATDIHKRRPRQGHERRHAGPHARDQGRDADDLGPPGPAHPAARAALIYEALADARRHLHLARVQRPARLHARRRPRYDPELARICYDLALGLFKRRLGEGDLAPEQPSRSAETKH